MSGSCLPRSQKIRTLLKYTIEESRVRWGDVDAASIIFYGAYIRFFEFAETELFRAVGLPYGVMFENSTSGCLAFISNVIFIALPNLTTC